MLEILNHLFAAVCGQNPSHTWAPGGLLLPCCQRCLGLYAGAAVAIATHWWLRPRLTARFLEVQGAFLLLMAPFGFHWVPQGPVLRTITGMLFGFGVVTYLWLSVSRVFHRKDAAEAGGNRRTKAMKPQRRDERRGGGGRGRLFARSANVQVGETGLEVNAPIWRSAFLLAAAFVLVPLLAARGGTVAEYLLSALAACGAAGLACLVLVNVILGFVGMLRLVRRLRSIPRGCLRTQP
jgi:uncharacterized membrane protein